MAAKIADEWGGAGIYETGEVAHRNFAQKLQLGTSAKKAS